MASPSTTETLSASYTIVVSPPEDSSSTDSIVALIALGFGATAFLIAFLQALLQYLTSAQRDKCLSGSIGGWSALTKTRWDFKRWRIRVQYARLNFAPTSILEAKAAPEIVFRSWLYKNKLASQVPMVSRHPDHEAYMNFHRRLWYPEHRGFWGLKNPHQFLSVWDLSFSQKLSWVWFSLTRRKHSDKSPMAKAGWANILKALSVDPDENLVIGYENADIIHSGVDVPFQTVNLFDLCLLCYMINIRDITMDADKGLIQGQNRFVRVETQAIPGLGQVVTFDGDFKMLHQVISSAGTMQLYCAVSVAKGEIISTACGYPDMDYFDENGFLYAAVRQWDNSRWEDYRLVNLAILFDNSQSDNDVGDHIVKVSPRQQAKRYSDVFQSNTSKSWTDIWMDMIGSSSPTIVKYLPFMPFLGIWAAAPVKLFVSPYFSYLEERRKLWYAEQAQHEDSLLKISQHPQIEIAITYADIDWLLKDDYCATTPLITGVNLHNWAWYPTLDFYQLWDSAVVQHTCERLDDPVLYLPRVVIRLMQGTSLQQAREDLEAKSFLIDDKRSGRTPKYTLETVIMLGLFTVDARLQALWCTLEIDEGGPLAILCNKLRSLDITGLSDQERYTSISNFINNRRDFEGSIEPLTADFMALWFELGRRTDLLGATNTLQQCLTETLHDWKTDTTLCVQEPANHEFQNLSANLRDHTEYLSSGLKSPRDSRTRKEFAEWCSTDTKDGTSRLGVIRKILPLLQLRIFLLDLSYRCHTDSSDVALAKDKATVDVRLI